MNNHGKDRSRKGQMPMAMVAVALLISTSFFCVISKEIEDSTENSESLYDEMGALNDEIDRTRMEIETNLGTIISDLSSWPDDEGGQEDGRTYASDNLIERASKFDSMCEEMLDDKYPAFNRGVTVDIIDHDIWLSMESMRIGTETTETQSSFLRAMGTVTANFSTESASTVSTMDIVADASSCLPLIVESATEFELSLEGPNSLLAQMVDYQLTALAQNRIMQGYGLSNLTGERSTHDIISEDDVRKAIRNALDILETMNFRANSSGKSDLLTKTQIDLADYMVMEDGKIMFDIGSFYAQAILSDIDAFALSWIEYLGIDSVFEFVDSIWDISRNAYDCIIGILTGKDMSHKNATQYIEERMDSIGVKNYLLLPGMSTHVTVEDMDFEVRVDEEIVKVHVDGWRESYKIPQKHMLDWDGWGKFYKSYNDDRNSILDPLKDTIRDLATSIRGSCLIEFGVDCFDDRSFLESVKDIISESVSRSYESIKQRATAISRNCSVTDPFMSAAYLHLLENKYDVFGYDSVDTENTNAVERAIDKILTQHPELVGERSTIFKTLMESDDIERNREIYKYNIDYWTEKLDVMNDVSKENSNIIIDALSFAIGELLNIGRIDEAVRGSMEDLLNSMTESLSSEPGFDITELPNSDGFELFDGIDGVHTERMSVTDWSDLDIQMVQPYDNTSKNIHYIGFDHLGSTTYCATYDIDVTGTIGFEVQSHNTLVDALGTYDARYVGLCDIDLDIEVPLITGWELEGVDYKKSNTLFNDVWKEIFETMLPFIKDMLRVFGAIRELSNICSTAMLEFANRITEMMTAVFEVVTAPIQIVIDMMESYFQELMESIGLEDMFIGMDSQTVTIRLFDTLVTFETDFKSVFKTKKNILKVTVSKEVNGVDTTAYCEVSKKGTDKYVALMGGGAKGDDWEFNLTMDPLLGTRPYYVMIDGHLRDIGYSGTLPEHVEYKRFDIALSDVPGIGDIMDGLPTPIPGVLCSVDAGAYLKCNLPIEDGLLINEVEPNPEGYDRDNEWVELFNNTGSTIDLLGYTFTVRSNPSKSYVVGNETIAPGELKVIHFDGQFLNNKNESLTLYDTYGQIVDSTGTFTDENNNEFTYQRSHNGYADWGLNKGSPGESNGENMTFGAMNASIFTNYLVDVVPRVFDEMGGCITTTDQLMEFLQRVLAGLIEMIIETVANFIVEAYLFIELTFKDVTGSLGAGLKVMLGIDSDIVSDTLRYLASMIPVIGKHIANPSGMSMERILMEDIYLRTMVYSDISFPRFLKAMDDAPQVRTGLSLKFNLSTVSGLLDSESDDSTWRVEAGILMEDVPYSLVPRQFMPEKYFDHDLWLFRMTFSRMDRGA